MNYTYQQKVLAIMIRDRNQQVWFYPPNFMKTGDDFFVGYTASSRLSEIAKKAPEMMLSRPRGKYMERRIKWEDIYNWWYKVPNDFRKVFQRFSMYPDKVAQIMIVNRRKVQQEETILDNFV